MTQVTASDHPGEQGAIANEQPLSETEARLIDAYWRAANYLSVGQIYLLSNPLLREPLKSEHVKPRLLGHWGTTPGLNFIYAHMNRVIRNSDLDAIYVMGPGHGGPAAVANAYLEGTYSELYPAISGDEDGMRALFRQFSFPGGIPSHVAPETPGSIHEGGSLGTPCPMLSGRRSITRSYLSVASSAMGRPNRGRLLQVGIRTSS
jgi:xylulose-5-phosphate/fructose-6-phosphate phosphoketolase